MSQARCACPKEDQRTRPSKRKYRNSALVTLLPTWTFRPCGGRRPDGAHQGADHVTQRTPRTLFRLWTHHAGAHCNCCLGRPAARRASRPAIRAHFFARAARRNDCNAGASATLGDDCNADATELDATRLGDTQHPGMHATGNATERLLTDADATQRNRDATERGLDTRDATQPLR